MSFAFENVPAFAATKTSSSRGVYDCVENASWVLMFSDKKHLELFMYFVWSQWSPSSHGVCENIWYLGNGMMGNSSVFYFSVFSHFLWPVMHDFIMEWHIFIKRKLFPSIFIVFKLLWSLSLKYTWDESGLKPLSVKTWKINTWGGEPRWCPEGKQREGDKSNVSPEHFPPPPPSPPSSSTSAGSRTERFGLCPLHPIYQSETELGHIRELLSEGNRAGRIQTQVSCLEDTAELSQKPSGPVHGLSNNSREGWGLAAMCFECLS